MMKIVLLCAVSLATSVAGQGCAFFNQALKDAKSIVSETREYNTKLQQKGYVIMQPDVGFAPSLVPVTCGYKNYYLSSSQKTSEYLTVAAGLLAERDPGTDFSTLASCMNITVTPLKEHSKYRTINAYGNNLKNPLWGRSDTPFASFGGKRYDDGIYSLRRSVTGAELPPANRIVRKVLFKAEKPKRTSNFFNLVLNTHDLYLSHDQGQQNPTEADNNCDTIRCCAAGNKNALDVSVSHSACMPVLIDQDEEVYGPMGIRCLTRFRAERAPSATASVLSSSGILNRVTFFLDHSMIYANDDSEHKRIRTFVGGKLNLGPYNLLPVDSTGMWTPISARILAVPSIALWVILWGRNHNNLCDRLAKLNPTWSDEKIFQRARRINIAVFQRCTIREAFPVIFHETIDADYDPDLIPQNTNEFNTAAYRFFHNSLSANLDLMDENGNFTRIPTSDTFLRIDYLYNFDDAVRGAMATSMNFGEYSDQMFNKFAKIDKPIGLDVISFDIQRGRDHGLNTYIDVRKRCGLKADFKTFEDLLAIFPQSYVDLLKTVYADVRDIDLYVGGALENFLSFSGDFIGETYRCVIKYHFKNTIASDAYFYTHKTSPFPFTDVQISEIEKIGFNDIICANSGVKQVPKDWFRVPNDIDNPWVPCSNYKPIDLTLFK